jgi:hypothetical protein
MLQSGMGCQDGVIRFHDRAGQPRGRVHAKLQFRLLAIVGGEAFLQEGTEPGTGSASEGVEDEETLESGAVIGQASDLFHDGVDELLPDSVMTTGICKTQRKGCKSIVPSNTSSVIECMGRKWN